MAALSDSDRTLCSKSFQDITGQLREGLPSMSKTDIRAAINAVDDWVVANATAFNNALPAAAKANMTAAQKQRLLSVVSAKRYAVGA